MSRRPTFGMQYTAFSTRTHTESFMTVWNGVGDMPRKHFGQTGERTHRRTRQTLYTLILSKRGY